MAGSVSGFFSIDRVLRGTNTLTVYKGELAVHSGSVRVTAGTVTALHTITIGADPSDAATIWRIGDWDGTPSGFKNTALMTFAHPSDSRALPWTGDFVSKENVLTIELISGTAGTGYLSPGVSFDCLELQA